MTVRPRGSCLNTDLGLGRSPHRRRRMKKDQKYLYNPIYKNPKNQEDVPNSIINMAGIRSLTCKVGGIFGSIHLLLVATVFSHDTGFSERNLNQLPISSVQPTEPGDIHDPGSASILLTGKAFPSTPDVHPGSTRQMRFSNPFSEDYYDLSPS